MPSRRLLLCGPRFVGEAAHTHHVLCGIGLAACADPLCCCCCWWSCCRRGRWSWYQAVCETAHAGDLRSSDSEGGTANRDGRSSSGREAEHIERVKGHVSSEGGTAYRDGRRVRSQWGWSGCTLGFRLCKTTGHPHHSECSTLLVVLLSGLFQARLSDGSVYRSVDGATQEKGQMRAWAAAQ